ncbi:AzlC family ABC transporter permease [Ktedonospora formicarum]|uniref:Transporter n=1 Tax=Ktedonospora formicarum TaxID=2778364 RepID=A0A8J3I2W9_9CHLR|nr:AzlC family ABC transporter permease [Ktedonospora formicarum]GHO46606.1 transporter [Ktedonospora formicarum]
MSEDILTAEPIQQKQDQELVTFSRAGFLDGMKKALPLAAGGSAFGLVYGMLAGQAHLSLLEVILTSGLVSAGSSQLIVLSMWSLPLAVWPIIFTTLLVNSRHILMGVALSPWFKRLPPLLLYPLLHFMDDESWALTINEFVQGKRDAAFLFGSGVVMVLSWITSTALGRILGGGISDPARWGLDFLTTAVFIALLAGFWKGKGDLFPWGVAAVVAVVSAHFLPGKWYILLGALAGSLVGGVRNGD